VRPNFIWKNFSLEEQSRILRAGRSNCKLDTSKLVDKMKEYNYEIPEIHEAYKTCFGKKVAKGAECKTNEIENAASMKGAMKRKRVDDEETTSGRQAKVS